MEEDFKNEAENIYAQGVSLADQMKLEEVLGRARKHWEENGYVELKEQDIMKVLKASYIAERFFGKSRSWISHKLNHDKKNGKPDDFTLSEKQTLVKALRTISMELDNLADDLEDSIKDKKISGYG